VGIAATCLLCEKDAALVRGGDLVARIERSGRSHEETTQRAPASIVMPRGGTLYCAYWQQMVTVLQSLRMQSSPFGQGSGIVEQYVAEQYLTQVLTVPPDVPPLGNVVVIASSVCVTFSCSSSPGAGSACVEQPTRVQRRTKALMPTIA
jgi:hypothetical protein